MHEALTKNNNNNNENTQDKNRHNSGKNKFSSIVGVMGVFRCRYKK